MTQSSKKRVNRLSSAYHNFSYFGDHESLDLSGMRDMGANTKVDHGSTSVDSGRSAIRYLGFDDLLLVLVVLYKNQIGS